LLWSILALFLAASASTEAFLAASKAAYAFSNAF
jgi:hypothetical protein